MDEFDYGVAHCFRLLNLRDHFQQSIDPTYQNINQKKFYLLKQFGVNLGFCYTLFREGPYSSDLHNYLYQNNNWIHTVNIERNNINDETLTAIDTINQIETEYRDNATSDDMTIPQYFTLLASGIYRAKQYQRRYQKNITKAEMKRDLKPINVRFFDQDLDIIIETINNYNFNVTIDSDINSTADILVKLPEGTRTEIKDGFIHIYVQKDPNRINPPHGTGIFDKENGQTLITFER